jgi:hypothetical protein
VLSFESGEGSRWKRHIGRAVKGLLVALAAVVVFDWSADPGTATLALIGAIVAVLAGDLYAEALQRDVLSRRGPTASEVLEIGVQHMGIPLGGVPTLALFVLAWTGLIDTALAIDISLWCGIALLGGLGFFAARLRGESARRALVHGTALAVLGVVVLVIKTLH